MRKIELQPTAENVLKTFLDDSIGRNTDIAYFISLIESLDECNSIALNSPWGSGKTFFVKQVKMILEVYNQFLESEFNEDEVAKVCHCYKSLCSKIGISEIEKPYLPIYYDAWKYDNDDDPVLSLVFEIISTLDNEGDFSDVNIDYIEILKAFADTFNIKGIYSLIKSIESDDNLKNIIKTRNLKRKVDEFLDKIPTERADKIIVFIDELDRCKPTYAVKVLERIKHYFNNDKILFVFSTNLEELQSSVKCVYGENFNAYRYLDRFFDLKTPLPEPDMQKYLSSIDFQNTRYIFDEICTEIISRYNFQLRDISKYVRYVKMTSYHFAHNSSGHGFSEDIGYEFCLHCLTPILIGLLIHDINMYNNFIAGKDNSPLIELLGNGEIGKYYFKELLSNGERYDGEPSAEYTLVTHKNKLEELYAALFNVNYNGSRFGKTIGNITIEQGTKKYLLSIINLLSKQAQVIRNMEE
ncbi:MAG: P-loop NTPase fold protein [Acutalibacteraceae bacterium]|nr:P-loop NTPase fold protein [Acutalibacteraceae bacterium]